MQSDGKVLQGHFLLRFGRLQHSGQASCEAVDVSRGKKLNGQTFFIRQLPEVPDVRGHYRNTVLASDVSHAARSRG